ncbi:hypothetical protein HOLleu_27936 [Holothuria leucospilota]|uniref:Uncharacterized protein n=1 Tax=Holothuria leucospilota TaxID=206669 RepID=A0A9Q1H3L2_HOLLE|nr:hypothetical protein HOLleu_27936 [Holothuria leucospilota]
MASPRQSYALRKQSRKVPGYYRHLASKELKEATRRVARKEKWNPNTPFEIEVLEEIADQSRIHYKGYSSKWDRWVPTNELIISQPAKGPQHLISANIRLELLRNSLGEAIKDRLISSKTDAPDVKFFIDCDEDLFPSLPFIKEEYVKRSGTFKNYLVPDGIMSRFLGKGWNYRIHNHRREFTQVVKDSFLACLTRKRSCKEFVMLENGRLVEQITPRGTQLACSFVRNDGNSLNFKDFLY